MRRREKRKVPPSRRRRAARRVLVAAAALFLVNRILLIGLLFPIQAIRQNEEREATGRTAVVCRDWALETQKATLVYLTENEKATMLSGTYLSFYGWMNAYGVALDCTEEASIHGGWWNLCRDEGLNLFYVFGRMDDPEIAWLEVFLLRKGDPLDEERIGRTSGDWGIGRDSKFWMEKDGRSYFLLRTYPVDWAYYPYGFQAVAVGYDEDGNEIARAELEQGLTVVF